jgi:hypothetical protein
MHPMCKNEVMSGGHVPASQQHVFYIRECLNFNLSYFTAESQPYFQQPQDIADSHEARQ